MRSTHSRTHGVGSTPSPLPRRSILPVLYDTIATGHVGSELRYGELAGRATLLTTYPCRAREIRQKAYRLAV